MLRLDVQLQYLDSRCLWAGLSTTVPGFPEYLGWTVSYSTWILRVFKLDCQLQHLDSQSVWAGLSASTWIVFGLDCQLKYLDSQSVWAGLSAAVPGFSECLGSPLQEKFLFPL